MLEWAGVERFTEAWVMGIMSEKRKILLKKYIHKYTSQLSCSKNVGMFVKIT
jgi:hypothetical protein